MGLPALATSFTLAAHQTRAVGAALQGTYDLLLMSPGFLLDSGLASTLLEVE